MEWIVLIFVITIVAIMARKTIDKETYINIKGLAKAGFVLLLLLIIIAAIQSLSNQ